MKQRRYRKLCMVPRLHRKRLRKVSSQAIRLACAVVVVAGIVFAPTVIDWGMHAAHRWQGTKTHSAEDEYLGSAVLSGQDSAFSNQGSTPSSQGSAFNSQGSSLGSQDTAFNSPGDSPSSQDSAVNSQQTLGDESSLLQNDNAHVAGGLSGEDQDFFGLPGHYAPDGNLPLALFEKLEGEHGHMEIPLGFTEEVFNSLGLDSVQVLSAPGVVGVCWKSSVKEAHQRIEKELASKQWQRIGITEAGNTYIKSEGMYSWVHVHVSGISDYASVVFSYEKRVA